MNVNCTFKSMRLVRFGDILFDQQRRLIMLCRSCQRHYLSMDAFQVHLKKCSGIKHIVQSVDELRYDEDKRERRLINGRQEMFIYEPNAVRRGMDCNIDWEAELEHPRWYTVIEKPEKSPICAKENVAKVRTRSHVARDLERDKEKDIQQPQQIGLHSPARQLCQSTSKRNILISQQHRIKRHDSVPTRTRNGVYVVEDIVEDLMRQEATNAARAAGTAKAVATPTTPTNPPTPSKQHNPTTSTTPPNPPKRHNPTSPSTSFKRPKATTPPYPSKRHNPTTPPKPAKPYKSNTPPMVQIPAANLANGETQQILNKLRACGVEVKRRNTRDTLDESSAADAVSLSKKQQALDIMRKLQSNGIKFTKVNNSKHQSS